MNREALGLVQRTLEERLGCKATFLSSICVAPQSQIDHRDRALSVGVFALRGHPAADQAYGWIVMGAGSKEVQTTIRSGWIDSPQAAIRFYLEQKGEHPAAACETSSWNDGGPA